MIYFSYGALMESIGLKELLHSAKLIGTASLSGYELRWNHRGKDDTGKCGIIKCKDCNKKVWGALYEVDASEKLLLDISQGRGWDYNDSHLDVNYEGKLLDALVYIPNVIENKDIPPNPSYKEAIVTGAKEHHLPKDYISAIESVSTNIDTKEINF